MPISSLFKAIRTWGSSGDTATPESVGIDRADGWDNIYSQARASGGKAPERAVMNRLLLEMTTGLTELRDGGAALPWDAEVNYSHPALVRASDGNLYDSLADSIGINPVGSQGNTRWTRAVPPAITPSGLLLGVNFFTASGTFRPPSNARRFFVILTGGGAGGGSNNRLQAGETIFRWYTRSSSISSIRITIGAGGSANANGGDSRFGTFIPSIAASGGGSASNLNVNSVNQLSIAGGQGDPTGNFHDQRDGGASFWGTHPAYGAAGSRGSSLGGANGVAVIFSFT